MSDDISGPGGGATTRAPATPPRRSVLLPTLITLGVLLLLLAVFTGVWTDRLWFQSVDYSSVFSTVLLTRASLFVAGAVVLAGSVALNVALAYRTRPFARVAAAARNEALDRWRASIDPVRGRVLLVVTAVLGVLAGSVAAGQWQTYLLWRNGGDSEPGRCLLPQGHRVLRLRLPVAALRHIVRVRHPGGVHHRRRRHPLPLRRARPAGSPRPAQRRRADAPVDPDRAVRAAEGVGLLAGPLRLRDRRRGPVHRRAVHRRPRAHPGEEHPDRHRAHLRAAAASPTSCGATGCCPASGSGCWCCQLDPDRRGLAGDRAVVPGAAVGGRQGEPRTSQRTSRRPGRRTTSAACRRPSTTPPPPSPPPTSSTQNSALPNTRLLDPTLVSAAVHPAAAGARLLLGAGDARRRPLRVR